MKLAVVGCRWFLDQEVFNAGMRDALLLPWETIVTGDATGVDAMARDMEGIRDLKVIVFRADWEKNGRAAGPIRNREIVEACNQMLAYWDGKSPGTKDAITQCVQAGKKVTIIPIRKD